MTAHRSLRSTDRRLAAIAVAAALMAAAPIGAASAAGVEPRLTSAGKARARRLERRARFFALRAQRAVAAVA